MVSKVAHLLLVSSHILQCTNNHLAFLKLTNTFLDDIEDAEYDELRHALEHWGIT